MFFFKMRGEGENLYRQWGVSESYQLKKLYSLKKSGIYLILPTLGMPGEMENVGSRGFVFSRPVWPVRLLIRLFFLCHDK